MNSKSRFRMIGALVLSACAGSLALGCSGNPSSGSPAYKPGELGNGGFLFACDDSVACDRWTTNNAKDFPDKIATGAVFDVRFVATGQQGPTVTINGQRYEGVTTAPVAPFISSGPDGFTTVKPGYGMIMVKDARGFIIDYCTVMIVKPDSLVVYDAKYKGTNPDRLEKIDIEKDATKSFRTVAEYDHETVAGSISVRWESADKTIAEIQSYSRGVVTIKGKAVGTTKLTAIGAALQREVDVEVTP